MNALLWRKYKWTTQNIQNIAYFFILPVVIMLTLFFRNKSHDVVTFYFPFITILIGMLFDSMDIESVVNKEFAMYTPITLKKNWIINVIISWASRLLYSVILLLVGYLVYSLIFGCSYTSFFVLLKGILNGISAFGIMLFCTQYEVDLSIWKQYLNFMWAPAGILWFYLLDAKSSVIPTGFSYCVYLAGFSLILAFLALSINKKVNTEKFILSLENVKRIASARFNLID